MKNNFSDEKNCDGENLSDPELLEELEDLIVCEETSLPELEITHTPTKGGNNSLLPSATCGQKSPESIVPLLQERLQSYNFALSAAKALGDNIKERRCGRGVKTLEKLIKSIESGKDIIIEDIPPIISIPKEPLPKSPHTAVSPTSAANTINSLILDKTGDRDGHINTVLKKRRQKYKMKALEAKHAGNKKAALEYMTILKTLDSFIKNNEKLIDISVIPPSPPLSPVSPEYKDPSKTEEHIHEETRLSALETAALSAASEPEDPSLFAAPPVPNSVLECLEQRLVKFASTRSVAENEGNLSKARRLQRIVKSYEKAIKDYKSGRKIDFNELPTPPGFAAFPIEKLNVSPVSLKNSEEAVVSTPKKSLSHPEVSSKDVQPQKPKVLGTSTSFMDKELQFLLEQQKLFRQAALIAKKSGNIEQAKEYLRMSKGFDSLIEASKCGLRIDKSEIPSLPQLPVSESDFIINEDLPDDQLEVTVEKGINFPHTGKPSDLNSYIKIEFPIPTDSPQTAKTNVISGTNNPDFQEKFKFVINRNSRTQVRQFKRQMLKLEVFSKGGFLRSDSLLGTVRIKLIDLESTCTIHDTFNLMDGRKMTGGKLVCKIRIQQPLLRKPIENVQ